MKHLKNVLVTAFVVLATCVSGFAQVILEAPRPGDRLTIDDRNIAPTIGTGGAIGGPTGLFTIYDGQTLRAGEYTFSVGYSNFDRDPGNVDITEVPISFQIGINDYLEAFFTTDAYRQIKVNSPRNLSSFSLPNSQVRIGAALTSPAALVLAPVGVGTTGGAIFRPQGAPFVQFPFVGGRSGVGGTLIGPFRENASGNGADLFPGVGATVGGILPGLVLSTTNLANGQVQLNTFTTAPSYLPDAPFLNRSYGESSFNTFNAGVKWRFTRPNSPVGVGVIPFVRFYADKPNDFAGFNQLQRGASPGGSRFEGGFVFFGDARVATFANVSANVGYTFNSPVKGDFAAGNLTILDRGDELNAGLGVDFPVNKYFQPIGEIRATKYVGGRTPNAFEQDPIDLLGGIRIFPTRFFSLTAAYRYNVNQQDDGIFDDNNGNTSTSVNGVPAGFTVSDDPHGFMFGASIGRRNARKEPVKPNTPASITNITISDNEIVLPVCASPTAKPRDGAQCNDATTVNVGVTATDPDNDPIVYQYAVSGGRISGTGANVTWDLSGQQPGTYTVSIGADDGCGVCNPPQTREVRIINCPDCVEPTPCPEVPRVTASSDLVNPGETVTFTADVVLNGASPTYNWSVSAGTIESGQGTPSIVVRVPADLFGSNVTGTISLGNIDPSCPATASATVQTTSKPAGPILVDDFGRAANDDIKARVDNTVIRQGENPGSRIFIISYGTPREVTRRNNFIVRDLTVRRGVPADSIVVVNGGAAPAIRTQIYVVPQGATDPTPAPQQ